MAYVQYTMKKPSNFTGAGGSREDDKMRMMMQKVGRPKKRRTKANIYLEVLKGLPVPVRRNRHQLYPDKFSTMRVLLHMIY